MARITGGYILKIALVLRGYDRVTSTTTISDRRPNEGA
jgi:hypothetical protein